MGFRDRVSAAYNALMGRNLLNIAVEEDGQPIEEPIFEIPPFQEAFKETPVISPTTGRSSQPSFTENNYPYIDKNLIFIKPEFNTKAVCTIRHLTKVNPDFGMALNNVISLANTGFRLFFDAQVSDEQADKMRDHITMKIEEWANKNYTNPEGLLAKWFKQLMIGGAIANEWVTANDLSTIDNVFFVHPEEIEFAFDTSLGYYRPWQRLNINYELLRGVQRKSPDMEGSLWKLNLYSFKYIGMGGDNESPYGIPPFLNALEPLETDYKMLDNIKWIVEQIGIWGFLQVLLEKPEFKSGQNTTKYTAEAEAFLLQAKERIKAGYRDGITVGFKDDTEFEFHNTSQDASGVKDMYSLNWNRVIRGLKSDPALFGGDDSRTETQITIVFTKMLSELAHYQNAVRANLEFGIKRELLLAGFSFKKAWIQFNASTLQDALKFEQAREVKIRNNNALYYDGIIDLKHYAADMGFEKPSVNEPRLVRGVGVNVEPDPSTRSAKKEDKQKRKKESEKGRRTKDKPQG